MIDASTTVSYSLYLLYSLFICSPIESALSPFTSFLSSYRYNDWSYSSHFVTMSGRHCLRKIPRGQKELKEEDRYLVMSEVPGHMLPEDSLGLFNSQ